MTESIKITAFFRPTSGNLFLPSSFHLLLKRPADGGGVVVKEHRFIPLSASFHL